VKEHLGSMRLLCGLLLCLAVALPGCSTRGTLGIEQQPAAGGASGGMGPDPSGGGSGEVPCAKLPSGSPNAMKLVNVQDCEILNHPLTLLSGSAELTEGELALELDGATSRFPIYDSRFKALAKLHRGENLLRFTIGGVTKELRLVYEPSQPRQKVVRLYVFMGSDGTGQLDAPPGVVAGLDDAIARVRLDGLLWQTFFAEAFRRSREQQTGVSADRLTFELELDDDDEPVVHVLRHDTMTQQELWQRDNGIDDWGDVVRLVNRQTEWPVADSLHIGFSLVTHVDPVTGESRAAVCAGNGDPSGGGVGLCGGSNLITHAASLDQVVSSFTSSALTDPMYIAEDSQQRGTYWAAYATTLGCTLSEGLRGLGLPYAQSGLLSAGCGNMNRFFMPYEVASDGAKLAITPDNETGLLGGDWFHPDSVAELVNSPFLR
jgi:hypothetical protein